MIVPPRDICGFADHYRRLYMPDTMHHIEPHFTVAYPFVPYDQLEAALPKLQSVLAQCEPRRRSEKHFDILLDCELEDGVEQHEIPTLKAILNARAVLGVAAGALNDVGLMHHGVEMRAAPDEVGRRYLTGFTELLLVPA